MTAQDKFSEWLRDDLAPWLKGRGFRRKDTTFRRRPGDNWQIINVQRSQWADAGDVPFTVNLGVGLPGLHDDEPWARRGWPLEYECDFRARLGMLVTGKDHWWRIRPLRPVRPVTRQLYDQLDQTGLPWLELHADERRLLAEAVAHPSAVDFMNLGSFVSLADAIGTPSDVEVARRELAAWHANERESVRGAL